MPTWVFHRAKDELAPISEAEEMVKALKALGNDVRSASYQIATMRANSSSFVVRR
jgi:predicted peptidase